MRTITNYSYIYRW